MPARRSRFRSSQNCCDAEESEIASALQQIEADYGERGIVVREVAGGYRFATSPQARDVVEAYLLPPKTTLSTPAMEALAIVAHVQPVTRGEIEAIRGVNSDSVVSTLLDRGFIAEAGRKDVVGRPDAVQNDAVLSWSRSGCGRSTICPNSNSNRANRSSST